MLHTSRQGIVKTALLETKRLLSADAVKELESFLKLHSYSGFSQKFTSDLGSISSFSGKELAEIVQIIPLALLSIKADEDLIIGWSLIGEVSKKWNEMK